MTVHNGPNVNKLIHRVEQIAAKVEPTRWALCLDAEDLAAAKVWEAGKVTVDALVNDAVEVAAAEGPGLKWSLVPLADDDTSLHKGAGFTAAGDDGEEAEDKDKPGKSLAGARARVASPGAVKADDKLQGVVALYRLAKTLERMQRGTMKPAWRFLKRRETELFEELMANRTLREELLKKSVKVAELEAQSHWTPEQIIALLQAFMPILNELFGALGKAVRIILERKYQEAGKGKKEDDK